MTNYTYLKMCLALPPEVFEGWNWQAGDMFCTPEVYSNNSVFGQATYPTEVHYIGEFRLENGEVVKYSSSDEIIYFIEERFPLDKIRPIPSQEQLQKICMKLIQCSPKDLLRFFEAWLYEDEIRPVVDFEDFDDLWLKYTMWVWGRKEWNGSSWV